MKVHLELTEQEQSVLHYVLQDTLADLRAEIGRTDDYSYRSMLKDREALIGKILFALDAQSKRPSTPAEASQSSNSS